MRAARSLLLMILASLATAPLFAYTIYLKDGSRLIAKSAYEIRDDVAYITLQNGTRTSIAAREIDQKRTEEANSDSAYGSALVLEEGRLTEVPADDPDPSGSLSDMISNRKSSAATRPPARRPVARAEVPQPLDGGGVDFQRLPRSPFSDLELAAEIRRVFRAQGVEQMSIHQGTAPGRMLIDLTTNSEAAVFRALEAAARALLHARDLDPSSSPVFELLLVTAERERAGQFVLTRHEAQALSDKTVETSTFFIENVRF